MKNTPRPLPDIIVFLLDYDDCMARSSFMKELQDDPALRHQAMLEANPLIIEEINASPKHATFIGVFSNRQSHRINNHNQFRPHFNTGSCFSFLSKLAEHCHVHFTPLLLADIFAQETPGTAMWRAIHENYTGVHREAPLDRNKILLTYLQAHYHAKNHPNKKITLNIYDDSKLILETIKEYFEEGDFLLPDNIFIALHHYEGEKIQPVGTVQGAGKIDIDYADTLQAITQTVAEPSHWEARSIDISGVDPWTVVDIRAARNENQNEIVPPPTP